LANGATNASLTLNGNINSTAAGAKTFTFGGYNTNTLTLNGVINENGGVNSVVIGTSSSGTVVLGNANNSFSGAITVTNATSGQYTYLSTANIGNAGQNSALGKNGTINIGSSSSTAFTTLRYTGTGEISDKVINLAGTTGGAILDQSGTGNLKFTSAMTATGVGAKAITLQGATAGTGELAGAISDLGGNVISLNKYGSGDWILSGNNSYTGATTVSGGTLTLSGGNSAASGGVTVTAGTLNVNSANALGSGTLTLTVDSRLNNTSGSAVVNSGNNAVVWGNSTSGAFTVGTAGSTSSNNLDLGTGTVTASASRSLTLLGTGTTFKMGTLENTSATDGRTFTFDGEGDNMILRGFKISTGSIAAVTNSLAGSANLEITGAIENGNSFANGVTIKSTGTTTFSGANTYTGGTEITGGATLRYGASDVTENTGGEMYVNGGTLNLQSYNDTVSSVRVSTGGTIAGSGTLTATSFTLSGNNTIDANLAGAAATLSKSTSGSLSLLNGNNTYGGTTTVSSGTLRLGSNTALGSTVGGTTVSSGGLLDLNGKTVGAEGFTFTGTGGLLNSSASSASLSGNLEVGAGMTVNTTGDITLSGQLTGISSRNLTKSGAGTLRVTAANSTFAGTNTVSAGTLLVDTGANVSTSASIVNGGLLKVNGTAGGVTVNTGGSLGGSGSVGAVTLTSGSFLKPGNSPGLLTAASSSWAAGSTYNWEIDNATGTAGTNWDVFSVTGALDLSALSSTGQMNLVLESLSIANYSTSTSYTWVIAKADSFTGVGAGVTDLTSLFNINSTAFNGGAAANLPNGGFQVVTGTEGSLRTLNLMAIPEPSTGSMLGLGLAGLFATRLLRRKSS
jgi:hypothetical protein